MSKQLRKIERRRARKWPRLYTWVGQWRRMRRRFIAGWRLVRYVDPYGSRLRKWVR